MRALEIIEKEGPARGMFLEHGQVGGLEPSGHRAGATATLQSPPARGLRSPWVPSWISDVLSAVFRAEDEEVSRRCGPASKKLDHLQTQALLLRYCASFCKVVHLFRTVPPHLLTAELGEFDKEFRESMESITGQTSDFTWAFMGLGCKMGGLGLRPSKLHALGGYLASFSGASAWIKARFPAIPEADIQAREDFLTSAWSSAFGPLPQFARQHDLSAITDSKLLPLLLESPACPPATWVASIQTATSSAFWKCLPSRWNGTHIDNACFRTLINLRYRQAQLYPTVCPMLGCPENLDAFGDHALCCKKGGEATIRHNRLTQRIALECSKAVAGVSLEARLLLQKSDERPADILLTAWRGGALALDVTVPHVRTKRTPESAKGLHAMEVAISRKEAKYLARCQEAGLNFSVLAFDTLGAAHPQTAAFLRAMFNDARRRSLCPDWRYIEQAWHRVMVPLQIDVARQILARNVQPELESLYHCRCGATGGVPDACARVRLAPRSHSVFRFRFSRRSLPPHPTRSLSPLCCLSLLSPLSLSLLSLLSLSLLSPLSFPPPLPPPSPSPRCVVVVCPVAPPAGEAPVQVISSQLDIDLPRASSTSTHISSPQQLGASASSSSTLAFRTGSTEGDPSQGTSGACGPELVRSVDSLKSLGGGQVLLSLSVGAERSQGRGRVPEEASLTGSPTVCSPTTVIESKHQLGLPAGKGVVSPHSEAARACARATQPDPHAVGWGGRGDYKHFPGVWLKQQAEHQPPPIPRFHSPSTRSQTTLSRSSNTPSARSSSLSVSSPCFSSGCSSVGSSGCNWTRSSSSWSGHGKGYRSSSKEQTSAHTDGPTGSGSSCSHTSPLSSVSVSPS